jgi:hypothetical protein
MRCDHDERITMKHDVLKDDDGSMRPTDSDAADEKVDVRPPLQQQPELKVPKWTPTMANAGRFSD